MEGLHEMRTCTFQSPLFQYETQLHYQIPPKTLQSDYLLISSQFPDVQEYPLQAFQTDEASAWRKKVCEGCRRRKQQPVLDDEKCQSCLERGKECNQEDLVQDHAQPAESSDQQPARQVQQQNNKDSFKPSQSSSPGVFDHTGQMASSGVLPKLAATLWEDEGTICFSVEVRGVCVARREDNCFINGSQLLNLADRTGGRLDGHLKPDQTWRIVDDGPIHLRGCWIPFEQALALANKERLTEELYPLFLHKIGTIISGVSKDSDAPRRQTAYAVPEAQLKFRPISTSTVPSSSHQNALMLTPRSSPAHSRGEKSSNEKAGQTSENVIDGSSFQSDNASRYDRFRVFGHTGTPLEGLPFESCISDSRLVSSNGSREPPEPDLRTSTPQWSSFPSLGHSKVEHEENQSPDDGSFNPELSSKQMAGSISVALETTFSPSSFDSLSPSWTDENQRLQMSQFISKSSMIIVSMYLRVTGDKSPCGTKQQGHKRPRLAKETSNDQRSLHNSAHPRRSRRNRDCDDSDDDDQGNPSKRPRYSSKDPAHLESRSLACPFNKYDNTLFGPDSLDESYHACATGCFVNIAQLKQHLQRNHYLPKYYCFRCCSSKFASQSMVRMHLREDPMCEKRDPPLYRERIGDELIEELGLDRKNLPGTDRTAYWHKIYDAFFPDAAKRRPVSPYYEGPAAEHLNQFLHFTTQVMGDIFPVVQRRLGLHEVLSTNMQHRLQQEIQQEAGQQYLQYISSIPMPQLGHSTLGTGAGEDAGIGNTGALGNTTQYLGSTWRPRSLEDSAEQSAMPSTNTEMILDGTEAPSLSMSPRPPLTPSMGIGGQSGPQAQNSEREQLSQQLAFDPEMAFQQHEQGSLHLDHINNYYRADVSGEPGTLSLDWEAEIDAVLALEDEEFPSKDNSNNDIGSHWLVRRDKILSSS